MIFDELGPENGPNARDEIGLGHGSLLDHFKIGSHVLWLFHPDNATENGLGGYRPNQLQVASRDIVNLGHSVPGQGDCRRHALG